MLKLLRWPGARGLQGRVTVAEPPAPRQSLWDGALDNKSSADMSSI